LQEELTAFLNEAILTSGAGLDSSPALISCRLQPEKNFAFIELRSAEEATNVMALDGVCLRGEIGVKVRKTFALGGWDVNQ
jgi:splicing factor U2AF subunit